MENRCEKNVFKSLAGPVEAYTIAGLVVNVGRRCNLTCSHCHLEASPHRQEEMAWTIMQSILRVVERNEIKSVELTGGAPELNPHLRRFITELRRQGQTIRLRTNLTVLLEPHLAGLAAFLRENQVGLIASLPCYQEEEVNAQRGEGVFAKSITALQMLNRLGYGTQGGPELEIVFNPVGAFLPGCEKSLEEMYRQEMKEQFGITFSRLMTLTNMPVGRFRSSLVQQKKARAYIQLLYSSFNKKVLDKLMCRRNVSVDFDGTLYDCDFNLALGVPVEAPATIEEFSLEALSRRPIVTGEHCLGCTAGAGSSCQGTLEGGKR